MACNDWVQYFTLASEAPYLFACCMHINFSWVRSYALKVLSASMAFIIH